MIHEYTDTSKNYIQDTLYLLDKVEYIMIPLRLYRGLVANTSPTQIHTVYLGQLRSALSSGKRVTRGEMDAYYEGNPYIDSTNVLIDAQSFMKNMHIDEAFFERVYHNLYHSYRPLIRPIAEKKKDSAYFSRKRDMVAVINDILPRTTDFQYTTLGLPQLKQMMWTTRACETMRDDPNDSDRRGYEVRCSVEPTYQYTVDHYKLHTEAVVRYNDLVGGLDWWNKESGLGYQTKEGCDNNPDLRLNRKFLNEVSTTTMESLDPRITPDCISFYLFESFEIWPYLVTQLVCDIKV